MNIAFVKAGEMDTNMNRFNTKHQLKNEKLAALVLNITSPEASSDNTPRLTSSVHIYTLAIAKTYPTGARDAT